MSDKIQLRGHCQCCCRIQAVTGGRVAKHGYEVKNRGAGGWFSGVCSGHQYAPVEVERTVLDSVVASIRNQIAELRALADRHEAGTAHPATCRTSKYDSRTQEYVRVPWDEAEEWERADEIKSAIWNLRQRANAGASQADMMIRIADERHGQPLIEVARDAKPAPIPVGERKVNDSGRVLEAKFTLRGMVYWKNQRDGRQYDGKMSTRCWRAMKAA